MKTYTMWLVALALLVLRGRCSIGECCLFKVRDVSGNL